MIGSKLFNPRRWGKRKEAAEAIPAKPVVTFDRLSKAAEQDAAFALVRAAIRKASKGRTEFLSDLSGAERRTLRRIMERKARRAAGTYPVGATWSSMSQRKRAK